MDNNVELIEQSALKEIESAASLEQINNIKIKYLSKKSELLSLLQNMKSLEKEQKIALGMKVNKAKETITNALEEKRVALEKEALEKKLQEQKIDITLDGNDFSRGSMHPFNFIVKEMVDIFSSMGYEIVEGPEKELDHFNFELLNVPKDHPARDMQDTFFINDKELLRSQTSPVQARVMLSRNGKGPIKIISPGKVFRRDDDATHSHQFGQIEGLVIDKNISLGDLLGTLQLFVKKMFGEKREIRMRSSYFPFTEPSVEVDISCFECGGKGCSLCKGTGWIEILGAGMVHPNVLKMCNFNVDEYQGFAFGIGIERTAMLKYGIDDIRRFYSNDIRFLKQFDEE